MNPNQTEAYKYLAQAQQARKAGDKRLARQYAEQATRLAPELEDVWLMMGALASPRASVVYIDKALQINPQSERVRQAMHWAADRLRREAPPAPSVPPPVAAAAPLTKPAAQSPIPFVAVLLTMMCLVVLASAVWASSSMAATLIESSILAGNQNDPGWAAAEIAKPTYTLAPSATLEVDEPTPTPSSVSTAIAPTATATTAPTDTVPPAAATSTPRPTPMPTATASRIALPTDTSEPTSLPTDAGPVGPTPTALPTDTAVPIPTRPQSISTPGLSTGNGERWIDVDLTNQMVYAYEGDTLVNSFVTSTGTWQYPTVTGQYRVYVKLRYKHMSGPGYSLPNVPFTMFFYQGYAIHGTYWHNNFGTPMSHGCVNLSIPDAEWIYNFSSVGTLVNVHY